MDMQFFFSRLRHKYSRYLALTLEEEKNPVWTKKKYGWIVWIEFMGIYEFPFEINKCNLKILWARFSKILNAERNLSYFSLYLTYYLIDAFKIKLLRWQYYLSEGT